MLGWVPMPFHDCRHLHSGLKWPTLLLSSSWSPVEGGRWEGPEKTSFALLGVPKGWDHWIRSCLGWRQCQPSRWSWGNDFQAPAPRIYFTFFGGYLPRLIHDLVYCMTGQIFKLTGNKFPKSTSQQFLQLHVAKPYSTHEGSRCSPFWRSKNSCRESKSPSPIFSGSVGKDGWL